MVHIDRLKVTVGPATRERERERERITTVK
jgi:hypothetical protein